MAIYKADIKVDYTVIPNQLAQDKALSFEARGLLMLLLSMPVSWNVNKAWVEEQSTNCGRDKTNRLFKELQEAGYIRKKTVHDEKGKITGVDWLIYPTSKIESTKDRSTEKPSHGKPATEQLKNRTTDKPYAGKPATIKETDLQNKHKDLICAFDAFWAAYPTKAKKKPAQQKFIIAVKNSGLTAIKFSQMLINDIQTRQNLQQFGFDKLHATTYLNQERWNDEYPTNQQPTHATGHKANSIEAHNAMLLAKYGYSTTSGEREINPTDGSGLVKHEIQGSVSKQVDSCGITIDMDSRDQCVDG